MSTEPGARRTAAFDLRPEPLGRWRLSTPTVVLLLFLVLYSFTASGWIESIDGRGMFRVAQSVVERGTFALSHPTPDWVFGEGWGGVEVGEDMRCFAPSSPARRRCCPAPPGGDHTLRSSWGRTDSRGASIGSG